MSLLLALDLGTTSIKAGMLDRDGRLMRVVVRSAPAVESVDDRYESDAIRYLKMAESALAECMAPHEATASLLGLSCQRSSFLLWDRASGLPVTPLISWQDSRGESCCAALHAHETRIHALTGLRLAPYYFAPKLNVLLRHNPQWRSGLLRGELMLGTLDSFLIWRWSGGAQHITDASMAARSQLMDIYTLQWSPELCALFDIPISILPRITPSCGLHLALQNGVWLQASVGDQSAALVAGLGNHPDAALVNLGTGGFVIRLLAQGAREPQGYLQTLVYQEPTRTTHFAAEGTINSIAAALAHYPVAECTLAQLGKNRIHCLVEPSGMGAPYFRSDIGLSFSESVAHLSQVEVAALLLEGIIFRVVRILEDFQHDLPFDRIYLSGGLSELTCLQQGIALCAPAPVFLLVQKESSLLGAALLAAGLLGGGEAEHVTRAADCGGLQEKYQDWKVWMDGYLRHAAG